MLGCLLGANISPDLLLYTFIIGHFQDLSVFLFVVHVILIFSPKVDLKGQKDQDGHIMFSPGMSYNFPGL